MTGLVLPTFRMDCRDWLVIDPADAGLPDEVAGAPLLAVLSTVVLGDGRFLPVSGVLTVGVVDDGLPECCSVAPGSVAQRVIEPDADPRCRCFVLAVPDGELAMLAEFALPDEPSDELIERVDALMASFQWT